MEETPILENSRHFIANDFKSDVKPIWCPGCGDFGVLSAFYKALADLGIPPEQAVIASGIGCSGRFPAFVESYGFHGVHGRVLPLATGIKMANPDLYVCAVGGDGDAFSIGGGHVPHAARRNVDITYIVMDNEIYGLTKGQPSPTSPLGMERKASPYGSIEAPLNPVLMALAYNASFVARGFSARPKEVVDLIKMALMHKGFAFLQILSPCVTFNDTYEHFKQVTLPLPADHNIADRTRAMALALDEKNMYLGVFYKAERPGYAAGLQAVRAKSSGGVPFDMNKLIGRYRT
jgi:2-oxoglutarate/2-oxoacid ferredoxin oxidoreductase subunit beta